MRLIKRLCGLFAALLCTATLAAPYPTKPVMVMVPYPAGGPSDGLARAYTTPMQAKLGQPMLVENLGGVSGGIAAQKVLAAPADGYYLFLGSPNELIVSPLVNPAIKFKPEDFRLAQLLTYGSLILVVRKDLPANSISLTINALAMVDLPLPESPVKNTVKPCFDRAVPKPHNHTLAARAIPHMQRCVARRGFVDAFARPEIHRV